VTGYHAIEWPPQAVIHFNPCDLSRCLPRDGINDVDDIPGAVGLEIPNLAEQLGANEPASLLAGEQVIATTMLIFPEA
jgi:hypothetical protein